VISFGCWELACLPVFHVLRCFSSVVLVKCFRFLVLLGVPCRGSAVLPGIYAGCLLLARVGFFVSIVVQAIKVIACVHPLVFHAPIISG